jgi:hypothetical protein
MARRSTFQTLNATSILKQTKHGDTPVHRAAKQGRLNEIPIDLLSVDSFLIANSDGRTPLHIAAMNSHLDQVPAQFLTEATLSARDVYGSAVLHRAAENGSLAQIPPALLTEKLMSLRNRQNQTVSDVLEAHQPTQRQVAYLRDLGVSFNEKTLTKGLASHLINSALREQRSGERPSPQQLAKIKRLQLEAEVPPNASKQDVSDVLEAALLRPASDAQFRRAAELGLNLAHRSAFTLGSLDNYLKLAERPPSDEDIAALRRMGLVQFKGTALEARLVLTLAASYEWDDSYDDPEPAEIDRACCVAVTDPSFSRPTISGEASDFSPDVEVISWPKIKMAEWLRKAHNPPLTRSRNSSRLC